MHSEYFSIQILPKYSVTLHTWPAWLLDGGLALMQMVRYHLACISIIVQIAIGMILDSKI